MRTFSGSWEPGSAASSSSATPGPCSITPSVAGIPLTVGFIVIVAMLVGRNHAATVQILGSPIVALTMILFIATMVYHMWIGMQVIIEDYVNDPLLKAIIAMTNTFFSCVVALASIFAVLKLS